MKPTYRRIRNSVVVLGILATGAWAWNSSPINLKDRIFPKHLAEVYPEHLYRSGQLASNLIETTLRDLEIDVIVDLTHDRGPDDPEQAAERRAAERLGIRHIRIPLRGSGRGSVEAYAEAVAAVIEAERQGEAVLVHCSAGDRRTGSVVAAYQILARGESAEKARAELERFARRSADASGLTRFLDETLPGVADILVREGHLTRRPSLIPTLVEAELDRAG